MKHIRLGKTNITVNFNGFGALPIQRISMEAAGSILNSAYHCGVDFYDTARAYTDSEEKVGNALSEVRDGIVLATKTAATTPEGFWKDLETSLKLLQTNYIDIYQFHNPSFCPKPGDGSGLYEAMLQAKEEGKILHIGITNHRLAVAQEAVKSGLYDTLQFPFSYLASKEEEDLVALCKEHDVGFICMKALSGGLITDSAAAYAYLAQFDNIVPIWGVQHQYELDEFISYQSEPPILTAERKAFIQKEQEVLCGEFCRGCGYCLPCPAGIDIPTCARMSLLLRRAPTADRFTEEGKEKMEQIEGCVGCNHCIKHCPYGLQTPDLLRKNLADYRQVFAQNS